jgi:hypothetical protein
MKYASLHSTSKYSQRPTESDGDLTLNILSISTFQGTSHPKHVRCTGLLVKNSDDRYVNMRRCFSDPRYNYVRCAPNNTFKTRSLTDNPSAMHVTDVTWGSIESFFRKCVFSNRNSAAWDSVRRYIYETSRHRGVCKNFAKTVTRKLVIEQCWQRLESKQDVSRDDFHILQHVWCSNTKTTLTKPVAVSKHNLPSITRLTFSNTSTHIHTNIKPRS